MIILFTKKPGYNDLSIINNANVKFKVKLTTTIILMDVRLK
jgi:hypothetical protein